MTWKNEDDRPHRIGDRNGTFKSAALDTDDTFSHTFAAAGEYPYICTIHPYMAGSHIVPVVVGNPQRCKAISDELLLRFGIYVQPINYPTIPRGTERLRLTPTPLNSDEQIDRLVTALAEIWSNNPVGFVTATSHPRPSSTHATTEWLGCGIIAASTGSISSSTTRPCCVGAGRLRDEPVTAASDLSRYCVSGRGSDRPPSYPFAYRNPRPDRKVARSCSTSSACRNSRVPV